MSWGLVDMKEFLTQMEFSLLQVKVNSKFWQRLPHHLKEEFPILQEVSLLLPVHRDLDRLIHKGFEAFEMVWVRMGENDEIDFFRRNPIFLHLTKEIGDMTGMTRIDQNRDLAKDQIGVAIVFIGILPKVGIQVFFEFHFLSTDFIG
jgi:hypothetical protein